MTGDQFRFIQLKVATEAMASTTGYFIRKLTRIYSKTFNTPLPTVRQLPLGEVLQDVLENKYDNLESSEILEEVEKILYPEDSPEHEELLAARIEQFLEEEEERIKSGAPIVAKKNRKRTYKSNHKDKTAPKLPDGWDIKFDPDKL